MSSASYSTTVRGWLTVGGQQLELAQLGPSFCFVREPMDYPPANAELFVSVDGDVQRRPVFLPDGISRDSAKVTVINGAVTSQSRKVQSVP